MVRTPHPSPLISWMNAGPGSHAETAESAMRRFRAIDAPIDKYLYLRDLHDTDSRLYYTLLVEQIEEVRELHGGHEGSSSTPSIHLLPSTLPIAAMGNACIILYHPCCFHAALCSIHAFLAAVHITFQDERCSLSVVRYPHAMMATSQVAWAQGFIATWHMAATGA